MRIRTIEELLVETRLFADLAEEHLATIAGCGTTAQFGEGEYLFREGDAADTFYVIRSGSVALETHVPGRGPARLTTLHDEDVLGWSWLFPPYRWHLDARALQPVRALAFDGACLRQKATDDHDLGYELMRRFAEVIVSRLQATRMQLLDVYHHPQDG
jgi:CRP-like cAMP-binding protein